MLMTLVLEATANCCNRDLVHPPLHLSTLTDEDLPHFGRMRIGQTLRYSVNLLLLAGLLVLSCNKMLEPREATGNAEMAAIIQPP